MVTRKQNKMARIIKIEMKWQKYGIYFYYKIVSDWIKSKQSIDVKYIRHT